MRVSSIAAGALACLLLARPAAAELKLLAEAPLTAPAAYEEVIASKITGRDYRVRVWAPLHAPAEDQPTAPAAMLYVIGGETDAGLAAALARADGSTYAYRGEWVVTVAPVESAADREAGRFAPWRSARLRQDYLHRPLNLNDYSPRMGEPAYPAGDGAGFQRFLVEELKPLMDARHPRPGGASILAGEGLAGTFVLTVAARAPEAFTLYAVSDAWLDKDVVEGVAAEVKPPAQQSWHPKLLMTWTSADHVWFDPERIVGQAFVDKGHAARWSTNQSWTDFVGGL